jgi:branched-chain amino acid transport system substrate-binding protein
MRRIKFGKIGTFFVGSIFIVGLAWGEVGVTDTTIKIGSILDLTGPAATAGVPVRLGHRLCVKYTNQQGGIHGRKIEYLVEDDKYAPPQTVAAAKKLVTRDKVFCITNNTGTAQTESIIPFLTKNKVPLIFPSTAAYKITHPPRHYVFGIFANYETEARCHADYIAHIVEDPKVFIQYFDADFGKNTAEALKDQLSHYGIKTVGEATHKYNTVDFSSHVLKAKEVGANVIPIYSLTPPTAKIALECQKLNFKPLFIINSPASMDELLTLAGSILEGAIGTKLNALNTLPDPRMKTFLELARKDHPDKAPGQVEQSGFFVMWNLVQALKQCGRDLTRENIVKVLESYREFDSVAFGPLTYGPNRRQGPEKILYFTIKNSTFKYLLPGWHGYKRF